jgi:hypothetical protein
MSAAAAISSSGRAGVREWIGLVVLALPMLLVSLDVSVIAGAAEVARTLPAVVGDAVLGSARGAFTHAINVFRPATQCSTTGLDRGDSRSTHGHMHDGRGTSSRRSSSR